MSKELLTSNLVAELRKWKRKWAVPPPVIENAADEIERLTVLCDEAANERDRLRALLRDCAEHFKTLREANVFVWPNHPLNPEVRIAEALRPADRDGREA